MATSKKGITRNFVPRIVFSSKKAFTPIIAIILILMMVVAIGGAMFYWLTRIQGQSQGGIESFQGRFFTTAATQANVLRVYYNGTRALDEVMFLYVQNIGNSNIPTTNTSTPPTTEWIIFDSNGRAICSANLGGDNITKTPSCNKGCSSDILPGQIREMRVNLSGSICTLMNVSNGTQVSLTLDFSGKTTTSASFIKEANP